MVALAPDHALEPYYRRELLQRWQASTADQRRRGRRWYATARELLAGVAARTGYTLEQAVAVLAITSPAAQLVQNVRYTERALESHGREKVGRFPAQMVPKVRAVLSDPAAASEYVNGPKVGAFHRAILGANELVLDRWAYFAAAPFSDREHVHDLPAGARSAIAQAYRNAARAARIKVRDLQAVIWLQTRESTPLLRRGKYVPVRFADITTAA